MTTTPRHRAAMRVRLAVLALALLAACTGVPEGVTPVGDFAAERYMGRWYSIQRLDHPFERDLTNVTAEYTLRDDGTVRVVNRGFDTEECEWKSVDGTAKFRGPSDVASLAVSFFGPFAGGYHVFALDRDEYRWAMVAGPSHDYLWILAREPGLDPAIQQELVVKARAAGFPVEELQPVSHDEPSCRN